MEELFFSLFVIVGLVIMFTHLEQVIANIEYAMIFLGAAMLALALIRSEDTDESCDE